MLYWNWDLKYPRNILSIKQTFTITSLIHLCNRALYAWTRIDTVWVCTARSSRTIWQPSLQFGRSPFNPHLPSAFTLLRTREYLLPGSDILEHRLITIRGIFRGTVIWWKGVIYIYRGDRLCYRFRLVTLATQVQEVESLDKTRKERVS